MPPLLKIENLSVWFPRRAPLFHPGAPRVKAVDDVSFEIERNAVVGLIGERGCGKTTLTRALARMLLPTSGRVFFDETDITALAVRSFKPLRRRIQLLFADCRSSLNPFTTVATTLADSIRAADPDLAPPQVQALACEHLDRVGLPSHSAGLYPRDLPHGHPERVALARALCVGARFLIIDDSLASLDLRIQKEFLALLLKLKEELRLTCLFACHDFGQLMMIARDAIVMSRGKVVEAAPIDAIVENPQHDFTKKLLASTVTLN